MAIFNEGAKVKKSVASKLFSAKMFCSFDLPGFRPLTEKVYVCFQWLIKGILPLGGYETMARFQLFYR